MSMCLSLSSSSRSRLKAPTRPLGVLDHFVDVDLDAENSQYQNKKLEKIRKRDYLMAGRRAALFSRLKRLGSITAVSVRGTDFFDHSGLRGNLMSAISHGINIVLGSYLQHQYVVLHGATGMVAVLEFHHNGEIDINTDIVYSTLRNGIDRRYSGRSVWMRRKVRLPQPVPIKHLVEDLMVYNSAYDLYSNNCQHFANYVYEKLQAH